jgi:adenylylsulfate kinase
MVVWLVGMYASGKSTLAEEMRILLEKDNSNVLVLNGGDVRQILGGDLSYSLEDRKKNAERISRICKYLSDQGMLVICAMLSLFEETRQWNRENIDSYFEVYIDVSMENLLKRDKKNLYRKALNGEIDDVVGVDIEFIKPEIPNLIIDNNANSDSLNELANKIIQKMSI